MAATQRVQARHPQQLAEGQTEHRNVCVWGGRGAAQCEKQQISSGQRLRGGKYLDADVRGQRSGRVGNKYTIS